MAKEVRVSDGARPYVPSRADLVSLASVAVAALVASVAAEIVVWDGPGWVRSSLVVSASLAVAALAAVVRGALLRREAFGDGAVLRKELRRWAKATLTHPTLQLNDQHRENVAKLSGQAYDKWADLLKRGDHVEAERVLATLSELELATMLAEDEGLRRAEALAASRAGRRRIGAEPVEPQAARAPEDGP